MKLYSITALLALALVVAATEDSCSGTPPSSTSDQNNARVTEQLAQQGDVTVGWPAITHFTEKKLLKMLYELRDDANLVTYSYYLDLQGNKHKLCPTTSVGYGIPYATQYTNPQKSDFHTWGEGIAGVVIGQPEPNGIYPPASAEGTWVMCLAPDGKSLSPVYVEPRVIVSQFPMKALDDYVK